MRMTVKLALCCLPLVLLLAGCRQKVNQNQTYKIEPGESRGFIIEAPKREQKIAVTVKSADAPVDVYLIEIKGSSEDLDKLITDKSAGNILASQKQTKDATVEGTVPAGSKFAAVVSNAKKATSAELKVTNAK